MTHFNVYHISIILKVANFQPLILSHLKGLENVVGLVTILLGNDMYFLMVERSVYSEAINILCVAKQLLEE